jgi:hypothetical protein
VGRVVVDESDWLAWLLGLGGERQKLDRDCVRWASETLMPLALTPGHALPSFARGTTGPTGICSKT